MTVEVDKPLMVSHSQIGTWNRCSQKWYFGYQLNWVPKQQPIYFERGHAIHEGLETYYTRLKNHGRVAIGDAGFLQELLGKWMQEGMSIEMISQVGKLLTRYIKEFSPIEDDKVKVIDVEHRLVAPLVTPKGRHYHLQGILDLLVEVNGKIWIVDHKSSGSARFKTETQVLMDSQLPLYEALLRQQGVDVFGMVFNFLNTYAYKNAVGTDKLFQRIVTYRTETELENLVHEFGLAVDDMYENRLSPRREFGFDCDRCSFQEPCLNTMRGIPINEAVSADFKQKGEGEDIIVELEEG
jgi:CRISPR/Cas system-associated exonuclease Cas4 (RecB family)